MTTIVKHRKTGNEYILLSVNGEAGKANPSRFISELFASEKTEVSCSATVCDVRGNIFLAYIDDLIVTEIDGKKPTDILPEPTYQEVNEVYVEQNNFNDDEEFDEEFDDGEDTPNEPQSSFVYGQGSTAQSNVTQSNVTQSNVDDDEEWI